MKSLADPIDFVGAGAWTWQEHMKRAVRSPRRLVEHLGLPDDLVCDRQAAGPFPLFVPLPYLQRIEPANPHDPLLRQVLPMAAEQACPPGYSNDPLGESRFRAGGALLQKYRGRALLVTTGSCAIHCRYCFRRHFPYHQADRDRAGWDDAITLIENDNSITEVILSGGDPLTLVDARLDRLMGELDAIAHVVRLRIHTRLPVVIPQRMTPALIEILLGSRFQIVVVVHCNHAHEIDESVERALADLAGNGVTLLNQAVLLKGVNDDVDSLVALSERLIACGILPYYLHQLDPVAGAAHYHVPIEHGRWLIEQLRERLPGYLVPRYAQEIAGYPSKTILA